MAEAVRAINNLATAQVRKDTSSLIDVNGLVETNLKNPMSRSEQEREDCGHAVYRNWCVVFSKVVVSRNIFKLNYWRKKKENEPLQC